MTVKISSEYLALAQEQTTKRGCADIGLYLEFLIARAIEKQKAIVSDGCDPVYVVNEIARKRDLTPPDESGRNSSCLPSEPHA